jgi:hypothetical protein
LQFFTVDLDPPPANEVKTSSACQQLSDFGLCQRRIVVAVESHTYRKVQERLLPEPGRLFAANPCCDSSAWWPIRSPCTGNTHDDPRGLEPRQIGKKLVRFS